MNNWMYYTGIALIGFSIVFGFGLIMFYVRYKKRNVKRRVDYEVKRSEVFLLGVYRWLSKRVLTRKSVYHIRSRFEIVDTFSERQLRIKVAKISLAIISLYSCSLITVIVITKDLLMIFLWMFVLWVLAETLVDFLVIRLKNKLLKQQIKFNERVRHRYYQSQMVDEAIYQACDDMDHKHYEITLQGERIADILMSKEPEKAIHAYNEVAPNKFLKMFLSLCYMTMEYGDSIFENKSVFMKNLHDLTNEIRLELNKREKLNYALRSLNFIVLFPLLMVEPIRQWASYNFQPLQKFYDSDQGFIIRLLMILLTLTTYIMLRKIQQFDIQKPSYVGKLSIEDRSYNFFLKPLIDKIKPKEKSAAYRKLGKRIRMTQIRISVEGFVVRQFFTAIMTFTLTIIVIIFIQYNGRHQLLNAPTLEEIFLTGQIPASELEKGWQITEQDNSYLMQLDENSDIEDINRLLENDGFSESEIKVIARRINNKHMTLLGYRFGLKELVIILVLTLIGYQSPKLLLLFRQQLLKLEVEDEVNGFSSIILMLMYHERLAISDVLEWFEIYSITFSEVLSDCINNLTSGMTEALERLREASDNERYRNIVDGLVLASCDITIRQAFDELEAERAFYYERRKEENGRIVEKKINLGNTIGFLPFYCLIIFYFIVPMLVIGMQDMTRYFEQLQM